VTLVDALPASHHDRQHLPGAVNLVLDDVATRAGGLLPDKDAVIVTYCSDAACPNSQQVAVALAGLGHSDVRKYRDGIEDWTGAGLPVESGPATPR
jgi:rhodanese-related sulfurtransferase